MCSLQKAPGKAKRPSNSSHFDPKRKQTLEKHGLEIWPGYVSVIGHYEGELLHLLSVSSFVLIIQAFFHRFCGFKSKSISEALSLEEKS